MSDESRLTDASIVTMTDDGSIRVPIAMREKAGLVAGAAVTIGFNDRGELVLTAGERAGARTDRFQSRLERSLGSGIARDPSGSDGSA